MLLQSVADFVGLIFFWTRWISVVFSYLRRFFGASALDDIFPNRLIATLKCESMVTPRPFDPVGLSVSQEGIYWFITRDVL